MEFAQNASKLHIAFGSLLEEHGYENLSIKQEVSVQSLCPDYPNGRDRFDYYISELNVVVELHGEQHYDPVRFGGVSQQKANNNYILRVRKDQAKRASAIKHGYYYICFSWNDQLTIENFYQKLETAQSITEHHELEQKDPIDKQTEWDKIKAKAQKESKAFWKNKRAEAKT